MCSSFSGTRLDTHHTVFKAKSTQTILSHSSGEAEFHSAVRDACRALGLENRMVDLGLKAEVELVGELVGPTRLAASTFPTHQPNRPATQQPKSSLLALSAADQFQPPHAATMQRCSWWIAIRRIQVEMHLQAQLHPWTGRRFLQVGSRRSPATPVRRLTEVSEGASCGRKDPYARKNTHLLFRNHSSNVMSQSSGKKLFHTASRRTRNSHNWCGALPM